MPRLLIQFVHQVRTIRRQPLFVVRPSDSLCDLPSFFQGKKPVARRYHRRPRRLRLLRRRWLPCLCTRRHLGLCAGSLFARPGIRRVRLCFMRRGLRPRLLAQRCRLRVLVGGLRRLRTRRRLGLWSGRLLRLLPCLFGRRCALLSRLRFLVGSLLSRLWILLRCGLLPRSLRRRTLRLGRERRRHLPQKRHRAHPKREKGPLSHVPILDDCFPPRAVPAAYPLLPLGTARQLLVLQRLSSLRYGCRKHPRAGYQSEARAGTAAVALQRRFFGRLRRGR